MRANVRELPDLRVPVRFKMARRLRDTMQGPDVEIDYTNHAGERRVRRVKPLRLRFGTTPKQDTPRYVIDGIDLERNVERSFTVREIHRWTELDGEA